MGTRTQQMHEFLSGYLGPSSGPPTFGVPSQPLNARLPVSPGDAIPGGIRPIPTSSQSNKKTNAQIPYVRLVFSETGTAGLRFAPKEGDIVLVEQTTLYRQDAGARLGHGTNSYAYTRTIESLNKNELAEERDDPYTYESFPYRLDGVINNVDSEDPQNEYRDYTIANVAIYGPCRLDHGEETRCCFKKTLPGSVLYVGLEAIEEGGKYKHKLVRFSSMQLSRGVYTLESPGRELVCAWTLGRIMDSNQSKNMVSVLVDVSPIRDTLERGRVAAQLERKWDTPELRPPENARPSESWH
tara:strand:- start:158 stop:1051 length:894 start_codon:yes stop_codon:yes gene_type:complete